MEKEDAKHAAAAARDYLAKASAIIRSLENEGFSVRVIDISIPLGMRDNASRMPCSPEIELDVEATRTVAYEEKV